MARPILTLSKPLAPAPAPAPTPAPTPPPPTKNSPIAHPNGGQSFGVVPEGLPHGIPGGDIVLNYGEHIGPHRGFGIAHIWAQHQHDLIKLGYGTISDVARYVADIIVTGAPIHYEGSTSADYRLQVIRGSKGMAIIQNKIIRGGISVWSVVTTYPKRQPQGNEIGRVQ